MPNHLARACFVLRHLKWLLTRPRRSTRDHGGTGEHMLQNPSRRGRQGWECSVASDERWFSLKTDYKRIWLQRNATGPVREGKTVSPSKVMPTGGCPPKGFALIDTLPKEQTLHWLCFSQKIRCPSPTNGTQALIHIDNAGPNG
jgi:hypothetical protein